MAYSRYWCIVHKDIDVMTIDKRITSHANDKAQGGVIKFQPESFEYAGLGRDVYDIKQKIESMGRCLNNDFMLPCISTPDKFDNEIALWQYPILENYFALEKRFSVLDEEGASKAVNHPVSFSLEEWEVIEQALPATRTLFADLAVQSLRDATMFLTTYHRAKDNSPDFVSDSQFMQHANAERYFYDNIYLPISGAFQSIMSLDEHNSRMLMDIQTPEPDDGNIQYPIALNQDQLPDPQILNKFLEIYEELAPLWDAQQGDHETDYKERFHSDFDRYKTLIKNMSSTKFDAYLGESEIEMLQSMPFIISQKALETYKVFMMWSLDAVFYSGALTEHNKPEHIAGLEGAIEHVPNLIRVANDMQDYVDHILAPHLEETYALELLGQDIDKKLDT